jgi:hypothetical protein
MLPSLNTGRTISAVPVSDREINNLKTQLCRAEQQVKIPKRVKITEILSVRRQTLVISSP